MINMKTILKELKKVGMECLKELGKAILKSALAAAINEFIILPLMRRLKAIYKRNPEMEREFGL